MARMLLTWELGAGLGHLVPLRQLAIALVSRGHEVFVAARDITRAGRVLRGIEFAYCPCPFQLMKLGTLFKSRERSRTFFLMWDSGRSRT